MKALVYTKYGPPTEVLQLKDLPIPEPKAGEVLVEIHAAAMNDYDWSLVRGQPILYRLMYGLYKPKYPIPGMEIAGKVVALGVGDNKFKVGDTVYGDISAYGFGGFAEYVCVHQNAFIHKPEGMSFEEAASISHAAMLAYQGLIDIGKIENGLEILINGAGGGMGTFGLQIAKLYNCQVTGVDTGEKLSMMNAIGYDQVLDYKKIDFTKNGQKYDLILDAKTNRSTFAYAQSLKPHGKYVSVGGALPSLFQLLIMKNFIKQNMHIVGLKPNKDLPFMNNLFNEGKLKFVIDGPYSLEEIPKLIQYFGYGKHHGKIVISIKD